MSEQVVTSSKRKVGCEKDNAEADSSEFGRRPSDLVKENDECSQRFRRGNGDSIILRRVSATLGVP